jgi:hypothetical protein
MRGRRGAAPFRFRHNRLELLRTRELLQRQLPSPPAVVLDVGGGTGVRAAWLAGRGYRVHLVDLQVPKTRAKSDTVRAGAALHCFTAATAARPELGVGEIPGQQCGGLQVAELAGRSGVT